MKKIYVCSRYAGETDENVKKAREYCGFVAKICGAIPIAPHIYLVSTNKPPAMLVEPKCFSFKLKKKTSCSKMESGLATAPQIQEE